jgi:type 1 glutamine amidotransferase
MSKLRILLALAMCGAVAAALVAQDKGKGKGKGKGPAGPPKLQALIITGQNPHDWRGTTPVMREILEQTGKFDVKVTEEFRGAGPETLAPYDLAIVNYYGPRAWGERAEKALENFVRGGKGLVLYHLSLGAFDGWTEYEKMSGGNWRPGNGHHSARHDWEMKVIDSEHPITRGMKSFKVIKEELYANLRWQPEGSYHVLATAYDDHALYNGKAKQPTPGPGRDQNILWTTQYGQGRVFITTLGHDADNTKAPEFRVTFARGAEWAATGQVTHPLPPEFAR